MGIRAWVMRLPVVWGQDGGSEREVYVMVGDGSYLMMAQEITTSIQEGYKFNIVLA